MSRASPTNPSRLLAAVILLVGGCGGGADLATPPPPPPPPAPVATVQVTPETFTPFPGDTLRFVATPKTSAGTVVADKLATWSSNAPAIATVSSTGLVTAVTPGSATITAMVDGRSGTAQVTVQQPVALDLARQVSKPVGAAGDSLTTTSSTGASYTLVIPANALQAPVTITLTPVGSFQGLGLSGGLLAGVKLEPSGTQFARPLELRIGNRLPIPAGKLLVGFTTPDAGGPVTLLPAGTIGGAVIVLVPHFSIVGLGAVLPSELAALTPPGNPGTRIAEFSTIASIVASGAGQLNLVQQLTLAFEAWFNRIAPVLTAGRQGDAELLAAIPEYAAWIIAMEWAGQTIGTQSFISVPALDLKAASGEFDVGGGVLLAEARANAACAAQRSLTKASLVFFWQNQAQQVLRPGPLLALGLDRANVLRRFCLQIINTELTFPDPVTPGNTADLRVRFGVQFGTDPNLLSPPHVFNLHFVLTGTTADGTVDVPTAADGRFTQTVVPTGQISFQAQITACLDPVLAGADDVCADVSVFRSFGRTIVGNVTVLTPQGLQGISDVARIEGSLTIRGGSGNPIADLEVLVGLQEVTGSVALLDLPQLVTLAGLRNLRTVRDLSLRLLPKLATVDGLDNLRTVPGLLLLSSLPLIPNLQGLGQLLTVGAFTVSDLPLVSSFAGLSQTTIQGLTVSRMPALTSLAGPAFSPTLGGGLSLSLNPVLANLGGLSSLTVIDGSLALDDNPSLSLSALGSLTAVGRDVRITGSNITSVAPLGIQRIGGDLEVFPSALPQMSSFVLPALTDIGGRLFRQEVGTCGRTGAPLLVRLPALSRVERGLQAGFSGAVPLASCQLDLELPALTFGGIVLSLSFNGLRDVTLGPFTAEGFQAGSSQTLRSIRFAGAFRADVMHITRNSLLQTLTGTGRVESGLTVFMNASLSQAAAQAWADAITIGPGGSRFVSQNKFP